MAPKETKKGKQLSITNRSLGTLKCRSVQSGQKRYGGRLRKTTFTFKALDGLKHHAHIKNGKSWNTDANSFSTTGAKPKAGKSNSKARDASKAALKGVCPLLQLASSPHFCMFSNFSRPTHTKSAKYASQQLSTDLRPSLSREHQNTHANPFHTSNV